MGKIQNVVLMPGKKTVRWNDETMEIILQARDSLVKEGWLRPTIRETLYRLTLLPDWEKRHYDTLCVKLGEWRDCGKIAFGLWADDSGGSDFTPMTSSDIVEALDQLKNMIPAQLSPDGYLHAIFVEHGGLVTDIAAMTDYRVPVVSSQGQIRREHLHTAVSKWAEVADELEGEGIIVHGLVDYDKGGNDIYEAHRRWLKSVMDMDMVKYGVTEAQVKAAKLGIFEKHQIDGWASRYGHERFKRDLRRLVGLK